MKKVIALLASILLLIGLVFPVSYAASPTLTVSSAQAKPGEEITVAISISNNPGIGGFAFTVNYDTSKLTIQDAKFNSVFSLGNYNKTTNTANCVVDGETDYNGAVLTLTFVVANDAEGTIPVSVSYKAGEIFNAVEEPVDFAVVDGGVTIVKAAHEQHTWDAGKVTKAATCKETGEKMLTCTVCGEKKTETIAKDASNHADYGTELKNAKAATCAAKGYTGDKVCKGCGAVIEKGKDIAPVAHKLTKTDAKAPTCTEKGNIEYYTCSVCKKVFSDAAGTKEIADVTVPAKGHQYGEWKVEKEATKTAEGLKTRVCKVCGNKEEQKIAPIPEPTTSGQKIYDIGDNNNGQAYINGGKCDDNNKPTEKNKPIEKCDEPTTAGKTPANVDSTAKTGARIVKTDGGKSTGDSSIFVIVTGIVAVAGAAFAVTKKKKF